MASGKLKTYIDSIKPSCLQKYKSGN